MPDPKETFASKIFSLSVKQERYFTWEIFRGGEKDEEFSSRIEVGHGEDTLFVLIQEVHRQKDLMHGFQQKSNKVLHFTTENLDEFLEIERVIKQDLNTSMGTTSHGNISDPIGTFDKKTDKNEKKELDNIQLEVSQKGLYFHAFDGDDYLGYVIIPSRTKMSDGDMSDENQLSYLLEMVKEVRDSFEQQKNKQGSENQSDESNYERPTEELISEGETRFVEFKETFKYNIHTDESNPDLKDTLVKEIAAFANTEGGIVLIGIEDESNDIKGIDRDLSLMGKGRDSFELELNNQISSRLGDVVATSYTSIEFEEIGGEIICKVLVDKSPTPVYFNSNDGEDFYVRSGTSSKPLQMSDAYDYIQQHWRDI